MGARLQALRLQPQDGSQHQGRLQDEVRHPPAQAAGPQQHKLGLKYDFKTLIVNQNLALIVIIISIRPRS